MWDGMPESSVSSLPEREEDRLLTVHFHKTVTEALAQDAA
jgi:hypothetical protein